MYVSRGAASVCLAVMFSNNSKIFTGVVCLYVQQVAYLCNKLFIFLNKSHTSLDKLYSSTSIFVPNSAPYHCAMHILHTGLHLHLHVLDNVCENVMIMSNAFGLGDLDVVVKKIMSGWISIGVIIFFFS